MQSERRLRSVKDAVTLGGMKINAVLEVQPGGYTAYIPALPGCVSEGKTKKEAKKNLRDALEGYLSVANRRSLPFNRAK